MLINVIDEMEQAEGFLIILQMYIINETPMAITKGKTFCR